MLRLIFNKDATPFLEKKLASSLVRFAIRSQGIRQFHDNSKIPDCCHIGTSLACLLFMLGIVISQIKMTRNKEAFKTKIYSVQFHSMTI